MAELTGLHLRGHRRHHSLPTSCASSLIRSSSNFCCMGRAGMRLGTACDYEDLHGATMESRSARFFTGDVRAAPFDEEEQQGEEDLLSYKAPSRWKMFCRKVKAETRKLSRWGSSSSVAAPGFHYDAVSYAMNFDDGAGFVRQQQQQQQQQVYGNFMILNSARFSGPDYILGSDDTCWAAPAVSTQA